METKKEMKEIVDRELLKKVLVDVVSIFTKYDLNLHDRSLIVRELVRVTNLQETAFEKHAMEKAMVETIKDELKKKDL